MQWIEFSKRKPKKSKKYFWLGKSDYGGYTYYDVDLDKWSFDNDVPVNKVSEDYLMWLDEEESKQ